jgi:hypothetical protein
MSENQQNWEVWARMLQRWGITETAAFLLEASGSMSVLVAQVIYLGQPLLSGVVSAVSLQSLAHLLENPAERQAFATFLRENASGGTAA